MIGKLRSDLLMQARFIRRAVRRLGQMRRYGPAAVGRAPVFFANSFPKSGTHLLTQVMRGFTQMGPVVDSGLPAVVTFRGDTGRLRSEEEILGDLRRLLPGDITYGHVHATPGAIAFLCRDGFVPFFILRDPRDVVVSHVHYITGMAKHHIHGYYYQEELHTFEERLLTSITGIPLAAINHLRSRTPIRSRTPMKTQFERADELDFTLPSIRQRFEPFMDWLKHPEMLVLRYEDFITRREAAVGRVFEHAVQRGFVPACDQATAIQTLARCIDPQRSPTFRSGKIGGWRTSFTEGHKALFKQVTGDLLIRLGYEENQNW